MLEPSVCFRGSFQMQAVVLSELLVIYANEIVFGFGF